ncbi:MAG: carboxypeptidase regulatory-like domain-containing protein, partial [Candidatus Aenigmarchaeota archaeon]|nr:carboxypeptidase regulatory-like domain-containing protein [Candidatus Aenigmarchaeota archaeon]
PVKVEGNLKNEKGQGIPNVIITFVSKDSNFRKSIVTDSSGEYSGEILPGEYNIVIEAKGLKAEFFDVNIDEFSDPLKFNYLPNLKVDGFINAGLYVLEAAFSYTKVSLNLHYDEGKILNESRISLFRCKSWNFVKNICYSGWEEVETQKDMVRNSVRVNLTSLSAFLVGSRRMLKAEFSLDKSKYFLEDVVKIKGLVKDELGERVGKAKVVIEGTSEETISEDNGYFEIEFIAPDEEGRHTFKLRAEKENYLPFEESFEIVLERKKEISLVIPKTVNVELEENSTVNIKVVNSGQTDFENVKIELSGIPEEFYEILDNDFYLPEGLSRDVRILFKIPKEANLTQIPVKVKANSGDVYSEKVINLVISKEKETVEGNKLSFPTAKIILPSLPVTLDILGLTLFSVVSIGGAFLLRKKRKTKSYSEDIRSLLFKIKEEVEGKNLLRREKDES